MTLDNHAGRRDFATERTASTPEACQLRIKPIYRGARLKRPTDRKALLRLNHEQVRKGI